MSAGGEGLRAGVEAVAADIERRARISNVGNPMRWADDLRALLAETAPASDGCCSACRGTGGVMMAETNGVCPDCYGTGCAHPPPLCAPTTGSGS